MAYAENTNVSTFKSREDIERTLIKYGAGQFIYATDVDKAMVGFTMDGRQIRFVVPMPNKNASEFTTHSRGKRTPEAALKAWEQACRQKWRALHLVIKAKLEAIDAGISVFQDEFMANIVLPDGSTVSDFVTPQIKIAYDSGKMPKLLKFF